MLVLLLEILLGLTLVGVVGVLGAGLFGMVRGGDPRRSNALMRWRVTLQGVAILLFVLLMALRQ